MSGFTTNGGSTVRAAERGEATCRVVTGMDENDHSALDNACRCAPNAGKTRVSPASQRWKRFAEV
jgi:hypothetical protein